jgi:hypothetical protein
MLSIVAGEDEVTAADDRLEKDRGVSGESSPGKNLKFGESFLERRRVGDGGEVEGSPSLRAGAKDVLGIWQTLKERLLRTSMAEPQIPGRSFTRLAAIIMSFDHCFMLGCEFLKRDESGLSTDGDGEVTMSEEWLAASPWSFAGCIPLRRDLTG